MSALGQLWRNENRFNLIGIWAKTLRISAALVLVALLAIAVRQLNLGIEFSGGASWEVPGAELTEEQITAVLNQNGIIESRIQRIANDIWRIRAETSYAGELEAVKVALAETAAVQPDAITANAVGASWGTELTAKARNALIVFFVVLFAYISLRLEWRAAVAALAAVAHDIIVTVGFYALFQFEVTSATVIAFLTILGYSLYDTLVVFDKIKENDHRARGDQSLSYTQVANYSANQVMMRSLNTTITSVIPVLAVLIVGRYILGAVALQEFSVALLVGLVVGTYSSLFIATPILVWFKEREAKLLRETLAAIRAAGGDISTVTENRGLAGVGTEKTANPNTTLLGDDNTESHQMSSEPNEVALGRAIAQESGSVADIDVGARLAQADRQARRVERKRKGSPLMAPTGRLVITKNEESSESENLDGSPKMSTEPE